MLNVHQRMAVLKILTYPDPFLLKKAGPVTTFDAKLRRLVADMFETMRAANGIGLAAPQIGESLDLVVLDIPPDEEDDEPLVFAVANPEITERRGHARIEEGCLSLPEFYVEVDRAEEIVLEGQDPEGRPIRIEAAGLLAICFQHELDHLEGKLLVNYAGDDEREAYQKAVRAKKSAAKS